MSQLIACPECNKHLQVPETLLGKKVQCPECKHTFIATAPELEEIQAPAKSSPPPARTPARDKESRDDDDDDRDDRTRKNRRSRDDDDDDYDDDRPRRRSGRSSRANYVPHRAGMILAFGIIGIVAFAPLAIVAWVMGNTDLREIREGRMDPEGEGMTNAGRLLGIIGTTLMIIALVSVCGMFGLIFVLGMAGAANAQKGGFQQKKRF